MPRPFNQLHPPISASFPEGIPSPRATPTQTTPTHKIKSPFHLPLIQNKKRSLTTPTSNNVTLLMIGRAPLKTDDIQKTQNKTKKLDKLKLHGMDSLATEATPPITCIFPEDFLSIVGPKQLQSSSLVMDRPLKRGGAKVVTSFNLERKGRLKTSQNRKVNTCSCIVCTCTCIYVNAFVYFLFGKTHLNVYVHMCTLYHVTYMCNVNIPK